MRAMILIVATATLGALGASALGAIPGLPTSSLPLWALAAAGASLGGLLGAGAHIARRGGALPERASPPMNPETSARARSPEERTQNEPALSPEQAPPELEPAPKAPSPEASTREEPAPTPEPPGPVDSEDLFAGWNSLSEESSEGEPSYKPSFHSVMRSFEEVEEEHELAAQLAAQKPPAPEPAPTPEEDLEPAGPSFDDLVSLMGQGEEASEPEDMPMAQNPEPEATEEEPETPEEPERPLHGLARVSPFGSTDAAGPSSPGEFSIRGFEEEAGGVTVEEVFGLGEDEAPGLQEATQNYQGGSALAQEMMELSEPSDPEPARALQVYGDLREPAEPKAFETQTLRMDSQQGREMLSARLERAGLGATSSSEARIRELYDEFATSLEHLERADALMPYERFAQGVRAQRKRLRAEHGVERLDMEVQIRERFPRIVITPGERPSA